MHQAAEQFREIAEPLYRRDPVTNTIELTLLARPVSATTRFF